MVSPCFLSSQFETIFILYVVDDTQHVLWRLKYIPSPQELGRRQNGWQRPQKYLTLAWILRRRAHKSHPFSFKRTCSPPSRPRCNHLMQKAIFSSLRNQCVSCSLRSTCNSLQHTTAGVSTSCEIHVSSSTHISAFSRPHRKCPSVHTAKHLSNVSLPVATFNTDLVRTHPTVVQPLGQVRISDNVTLHISNLIKLEAELKTIHDVTLRLIRSGIEKFLQMCRSQERVSDSNAIALKATWKIPISFFDNEIKSFHHLQATQITSSIIFINLVPTFTHHSPESCENYFTLLFVNTQIYVFFPETS